MTDLPDAEPSIPEEIRRAAMMAIHVEFGWDEGIAYRYSDAALAAALPLLAEHWATRIERVPSAEAPDDFFRGYRSGLADAARLVRGLGGDTE